MSASVAGYHFEGLGKDVNDLALALVAPLGSNNNRSSASTQFALRLKLRGCPAALGSHTLIAPRMDDRED
jgi:hypothetical protein